MPLAATAPRSRLTAATKSRQPIASSSTTASSAHPTSSSLRSRSATVAHSAPVQPPPLVLELPPSLPTLSQLEAGQDIKPCPQLISRRLISLARCFLALHPDSASPDPLDWELDLCSATFFSIYAVCLDPSSTVARSILARCARLGGFNIVLPFSPSASAASSAVSASKLSSQDPHDPAGAHACIHILQQGSAGTFQDATSAREYRDACRTLGRSSDALQVTEVLRDKALGKRKATDSADDASFMTQPVSSQSRYQSQLQTDEAYIAASRGRVQQAQTIFLQAIELDPFNWRAWAGLCDTGYAAASASKHLGTSTLDRLYSNLVAQVNAPYVAMEASLRSSQPFSHDQPQSSTMVRKVSEDGANKKLKVSSEIPPVPSLPPAAARNGVSSRPIDNVTPPLPTTSASAVTATRLHPASRALSAAQTNTHHLEPVTADHDDVKAAKAAGNATRPTRTAGVRTATVTAPTATNARQLRSTRGNTGAPTAASAVSRTAAATNRAGATSAAGSVSSTTSSGSSTSSVSSRATVSTARTAVSARRVTSAAAPNQASLRAAAAKPTSASSARTTSTTNGTSVPPKRTTTSTTSRLATAGNVSRPGSAMSKASSTSVGGASTTARTNLTLASSRTAAEAMRLKEEENARAKLDALSALREPIVQQLTAMAHQQAADRYVLALLAQVGEAYRLLRLCEGEKAAAVLLGSVTGEADAVTDVKPRSIGVAAQPEELTVDKAAYSEAARFLDLLIKDSLLHHMLLGRSYAESSQYASSEHHFAAVTKLNPYIASHMDVYSLVLFHLSREVKLSALAQHLAMVAPGTASTDIVVGNAFSLQKEHQTALVCFQRAAAAAPDYAYAYTLAGHEAHDLGMHDEAIAYFRSAIRCDRRHWNAWAGLGRVYLGIGEHEHAACKSLQQAIHLNPGNHILWDLVGWTFSLLNAPSKALECYDRAIELAPGASVLTYLRRAELLLQHGDAESSHRDLVKAHDLAPEEASIHILLAQSYMRLGGGSFCHLEGSSESTSKPTLRASGTMVLPQRFQAEITHHLSVAVDLDPSLLRLVKSICEGYKSLPGSKLLHPTEFMDSMMSADESQMGGGSMEDSYAAAGHSASGIVGGVGNSTPHHLFHPGAPGASAGIAGMVLQPPPADFATTHPGMRHDSSSFLNTASSSFDVVLHDADVSL